MKKNQRDEIISLCRKKVNKMLSSLNSNKQNIFIPKYTITNKTESNYLSNINNNQKHKLNSKKICKNKITNIIDDDKPNNKERNCIDFIINHGILVYQRNMKGQEIINYGINKNKNLNKKNIYGNITYRTETNFNKNNINKKLINNTINKQKNAFKKKFKINNLRKTNYSFKDLSHTSKNTDYIKHGELLLTKKNKNLNEINNKNYLCSNTLYNINEKENINIDHNRKNIINISKKKSLTYIKPAVSKKTIQEINIKTIYLYNKLKKLFIKRIKYTFNLLKLKFFGGVEIKLENECIFTKSENINTTKNKINYIKKHKKSKSILVNKRLISKAITSRSNNYFKNIPNIISENFQFFPKNRDEPELYRDSKSLEKKYEQICRRKNLNMTLTFIDSFRQNILFKENQKLSTEKYNNSYSNFKDNNSIFTAYTKIIKNTNYFKESPITLINSNNNDANFITDKSTGAIENLSFKMNLIRDDEDKRYFNKNDSSNRVDKKSSLKDDTSFNFSYDNKIFKEDVFYHNNNENFIQSKAFSNKNNISKDMFNKKVKQFLQKEKIKSNKNKNKFHSVKNICTNDKRIYICIKYLEFIPPINENKNNKFSLNITQIFDFKYIPTKIKRKRIKKTKSDLKIKLPLIKEEDEKSNLLNSIKNTKDNNLLNIYVLKYIKYFNIFVLKLINILEKNIFMRKKVFFSNFNKLIKKQKKAKHIKKNISNIIIRDKIFLNNIFINSDNNLFGSRSLDFGRNFNVIDSFTLKGLKNCQYSAKNINK